MRNLLLIILCVAISGCARNVQPSTPEEVAERETRMRQFLKDSSPRAMNNNPKAVDEYVKTFKVGNSDPSSITKKSKKEKEEVKENS